MNSANIVISVLMEILICIRSSQSAVPVIKNDICRDDISLLSNQNAQSKCLVLLVVMPTIASVMEGTVVQRILELNEANTSYVIDYMVDLRDIRKATPYSYTGYEIEDVILVLKTYNKLLNFYNGRGVKRLLVNPNARYFIILYDQCAGDGNTVRTNLLYIFRSIWKFDEIVNVKIIVLCAKRNINCVSDNLRFVCGYDAYDRDSDKEWGKLVDVDFKEATDKKKVRIRDLNGYPLTVTVFPSTMVIEKPRNNPNDPVEFEGMDIDYAENLAKLMNFTPIYRQPAGLDPFGDKLPNGSFTGALGDLTTGKTDLCFVGFFIKDYESPDLVFTPWLFQDKLCIMVPKAERIPGWMLLSRCFPADLWIYVLILVLSTSLIYIFFEQVTDSALQRKAQVWHEPAWGLVAILVSSPLSKLPTLTSERVFLSACLIWSLTVITGILQGSLTYVYTRPMFYPDIASLKMLDESGLPITIVTTGVIKDMFGVEPKGTVLGNLRSKVKIYDTMDHILQDLIHYKDIGVIERMVNIITLIRRYINPDGSSKVFMVPQCPRRYMISYLLPKRSPYYKEIRTLVFRINEVGFKKKWLLKTLHQITRDAIKAQQSVEGDQGDQEGHITLNLGHLQIAFILLVLGSLISLIVFFWELLRYRRSMKKSTRSKSTEYLVKF